MGLSVVAVTYTSDIACFKQGVPWHAEYTVSEKNLFEILFVVYRTYFIAQNWTATQIFRKSEPQTFRRKRPYTQINCMSSKLIFEKFEDVGFKYDKSFDEILAQKYANKAFLVLNYAYIFLLLLFLFIFFIHLLFLFISNLRVFSSAPNFGIRQI